MGRNFVRPTAISALYDRATVGGKDSGELKGLAVVDAFVLKELLVNVELKLNKK